MFMIFLAYKDGKAENELPNNCDTSIYKQYKDYDFAFCYPKMWVNYSLMISRIYLGKDQILESYTDSADRFEDSFRIETSVFFSNVVYHSDVPLVVS